MAVPHDSATDGDPAAGEINQPAEASLSSAASPHTRTKSPGVRVIRGRIYDSELGKSCHQCRQKTMDFSAPCRQIRRDKLCPIKFCHKCLLNRYGEKVEEVAMLENWICPKCRGVCNCSFCMKKKGHQPTGILIHTAKATGFSSVHAFLDSQGSDVLNAANGLRSLSAANPAVCKKGSVTPKRSHGKENYHDEQNDIEPSTGADNNQSQSSVKKENKRTLKKLKSESDCGEENAIELYGINAIPKNDNVQVNKANKSSANSIKMEMQPNNDEPVPTNCANGEVKSLHHVPKPPKRSNDDTHNWVNTDEIEVSDNGKNDNGHNRPPCKVNKFWKHGTKNSNIYEAKVLADMQNKNVKAKRVPKEHRSRKCGTDVLFEYDNLATVVPHGAPLIEVAGADWAAEDVGAALQFLEFCNAFSEVLDIKKGEPESVLRELARGCVGRRGVYSSVVKFHIKLLSFIQKDMDDESASYSTSTGDKWLQSIVKCINESECALEIPLDCLNRVSSAYDSWDPSDKLKLLNLLCDRTLGTEEMRNWIDEDNKKYIERKKEAKGTVIAAKKKGKDLKKKLKDDVAKAMLSLREGPPLSIAEHDNIVSQIRAETEKTHVEMLEIMEQLPKNSDNIRRDAVRTEPILLEGEGRLYWKLGGCCRNSKIILQDIGSWDSVMLGDKWFAYDEEEEKSVERHIASSRNRRRRLRGSFLKKESECLHGISYDSCDNSTSPNFSAEGDNGVGNSASEQEMQQTLDS